MRRILQTISWIALAGTIAPAVLFYYGKMDLPAVQTTMLVTTVVWFAATSMWMGREEEGTESANAGE